MYMSISSAPRIEQTASFSVVFLKSGVNVAKYLKKSCSCGQPKQNFFKYFATQPSDFEKMSMTNDVCLFLGADELKHRLCYLFFSYHLDGGIDVRVHSIKIKSNKEREVGLNIDLFNSETLVRYPLLESFSKEELYRRSILLHR